MLVEKITSRQNPLVKRFRKVKSGTERSLVFLEGVRIVEDALSTGVKFESVVFTSELGTSERGALLLQALQSVQCRGSLVSRQVMDAISETRAPQGIAAIVSRPYFELDNLFESPPGLLVIADALQDPGNLGTIIRSAEAAGADGLITTNFTVDAFGEKAIRASMGSSLRLPIVTNARLEQVVARCREHKLKVIVSIAPSGGFTTQERNPAKTYTECNMASPLALIVGREATGVSPSASLVADELIYIPMARGVESLNVASAAAILLYEAARQREFQFDAGSHRYLNNGSGGE